MPINHVIVTFVGKITHHSHVLVGTSVGELGITWELIGTSVGALGITWELIGTSLGALGITWELIGTSLGALGITWELIGTSVGALGITWELIGTSVGALGITWELIGLCTREKTNTCYEPTSTQSFCKHLSLFNIHLDTCIEFHNLLYWE